MEAKDREHHVNWERSGHHQNEPAADIRETCKKEGCSKAQQIVNLKYLRPEATETEVAVRPEVGEYFALTRSHDQIPMRARVRRGILLDCDPGSLAKKNQGTPKRLWINVLW
ncbi:hypothetical protein B0H11DRAFT_2193500 [Mycena galericulata]|nr:hypothetical protein B0H11DRAFT_2193500 [Mycena galericulata]